jgi:HAD superfamily hydrolase (TIGR01549 family)
MLCAVIWDFDGTICDTYPAIARAVNLALARFGAQATLAHIIDLASISLEHCIRTLAEDFALPYDQVDAAFSETYQQVQPTDQPPFPGVRDLCQRLTTAGIHNFIVTHRRHASLQVLLTIHDLRTWFTHIIAADDGFPRKPAPDAMRHLLTTYGIAASDALVIGDRELDIRAGQAAGIPTCLFRGTIPEPAPSRTITNFAELMDLVPPVVRGAA